MSTTSFILAITSGFLIILALVWVISRQLKLDKKRKQEMKEAQDTVLEGRNKRIESIRVLLKVVGSDDLGWMEASIRIKTWALTIWAGWKRVYELRRYWIN